MPRLTVLPFLLLLTGPAAAVDTSNGRGQSTKYVIAFGSNYDERTPALQLFISTLESFPVSFQVMTLLGYNYHGIVLPNSATNVTIPSSYEISSFNDTDKGISITTDNGTIIVHGLNYYSSTTDGFLALPCTPLKIDSYEYYGLTYHDSSLEIPGFLVIVGCDDSTVVNHGSSTTILNKMETLYLQDLVDFSGTRIKSNKPVSFFSGHACTNVPGGVRACDHLVEQIPPTAVWGTHFLSASYLNRSSGELYRILTASNSTTVTVNCNTFSQPQTLSLTSAGSWTEFRTNDSSLCSIESNNPLLVMEFSQGRTTDEVSDPFMMMIPSVDQYNNNYVFHSPSTYSNYITILVTPLYYQPEQILVDGVSQENANWAPVHCANGSVCGYRAYVALEPGDHHVWHSDTCAKISVLMYGFVYKSSYGQPAGVFLTTKNLIIPSNFSHTVLDGDPHSVRFTWSPPPEQEQSGEITHYTINCTSEGGGIGIRVNTTGLEIVISTFAPATHYQCSISVSTLCGEKPHSDVINILTIPSAVMGLTWNVTQDEFIIHWDGSVGVVSHYVVVIKMSEKELNFNVTAHNLSLHTGSLSGDGIIEVNLSAVNDAGIGPSTTITIVSKHMREQSSSQSIAPIIVGGSVSAALVVILVFTTILALIFVWRRRFAQTPIHSQPHTETHKMKERDMEGHIYDIPHFNPAREEITTTPCVAYGTNRRN